MGAQGTDKMAKEEYWGQSALGIHLKLLKEREATCPSRDTTALLLHKPERVARQLPAGAFPQSDSQSKTQRSNGSVKEPPRHALKSTFLRWGTSHMEGKCSAVCSSCLCDGREAGHYVSCYWTLLSSQEPCTNQNIIIQFQRNRTEEWKEPGLPSVTALPRYVPQAQRFWETRQRVG